MFAAFVVCGLGRSSLPFLTTKHNPTQTKHKTKTTQKVAILRQGYLWKRSSGKGRADWKRRFFVLDSTGMLYYYSHKV